MHAERLIPFYGVGLAGREAAGLQFRDTRPGRGEAIFSLVLSRS